MKQIPLTQGQFALVDNEDFEWLNQWKWYAHRSTIKTNFYVDRKKNKYKISMHRLILGLEKGDKREVDHINHNGLDNRRCNLRVVTKQQNNWNRRNTKGYYWNKRDKKWVSYICARPKIVLGYFNSEQKARESYLKAKEQYHIFTSL